MKSIEKPLMFAFAVMAITAADQTQAIGTKGNKPYKFYIKLLIATS
jgi:hypothetical protein